MRRTATAIGLMVVLAMSLATQTACDKGTLVANAKRVNSALREVQPILVANGINSNRLTEAMNLSEQLVRAFEASDSTNALSLTSELITAFNGLVAQDVVRISNPTTRTIVLVGLAVGNIALRNIADALAEQATNRPMAGPMGASGRHAAVVQAFRTKKKWRCRSSITGRFAKMSVCKSDPSHTTVETY